MGDSMEFSGLAQDFVEATSMLVNGRTINIMDRQGIIIASTEHERIHTFHQGAADVIATGRAVYIRKEDLDRYPGAKEGYNMPIFLDGKLIGAVGIFGEEKEVEDIANLLKVYVTQYFQQQEGAKRAKLESELRTRILKLYLLGDEGHAETISDLCQVASSHVTFPVVLYLLTERKEMVAHSVNQYSQLEQVLSWKGLLDTHRDIFGIHDNGFLILHGSSRTETEEAYTKRISRFVQDYGKCRLIVSGSCESLDEIPRGLKEVNALAEITETTVADMKDYGNQIHFLTHRMLRHGGSYYAEKMYRQLASEQDEEHIEQLLMTAKVYYEEGGSVTKAANRLHLHKNTLLYRMKRIYTLLGIEQEQVYAKEFFIRFLLEYHPVEYEKE